ncbi:MAG: molecular chaperone TorD family protein [Candidatus Bathyarchaeia archaeon]
MDKSDLAVLLKGRESLYSFLSRICEREVDEQLLRDLISRRDMFLRYKFIIEPNADEIIEGFIDLYNYLARLKEENIEKAILELAVDYANLFLGVGYAHGKGIAHPSESVYIKGYLYSNLSEKVFEEYLEEGLVKSPDFKEPEDHIALELHFMAHLCRKAIVSLESGRSQDLLKYLKKQKAFMLEHLLRWAPKLAEDIIENANTLFYRAIGKILKEFLRMEEKSIDEFIELAKKQ